MLGELAFDDRFLVRLPLPLAQLFRRAVNAKAPLEQHLAAARTAELGIKLLACSAIVEYAALGQPDAQINEILQNLARPALGHWWEFARRLIPLLADAGRAGFDPLRQLLLGRARDDFPRAAGLDAVLRETLGLGSGSRTTVRLSELFDRLIQHRNKGQAHAAPEMRQEAYHRRLAEAMLAGLSEVYERLDVLAGARLIYVSEVRQSGGQWTVQPFELIGEHSRRLAAWSTPLEKTASLPSAEQVYLLRTNQRESGPGGGKGSAGDAASWLPLNPLVFFDSESEELLLLNSRHGREQVEYLGYTSGRVERQPAILQGQHAELLAKMLKMDVDPNRLASWAARSKSDEPPEEEPLQSQRTLGEFELLSELGRGGMGVVYRAWQPSLGRQVALKKLVRTGDKSDQRFSREIRALGRVEHPHLVKIYTSGNDGDQWFYAMELVEGAPMATICEQLQSSGTTIDQLSGATWQAAVTTACSRARQNEKPLAATPSGTASDSGQPRSTERTIARQPVEAHAPPRLRDSYVRQVVELVRQAALAADALHAAGIVHRDIKPGNIVITADGLQAVLMDLGLAQLADDEDGQLTRTREFVGTLRYASPQQVLAAEHLDRRSDVYSLGATLWELLTLRPMFDADENTSTPALMERILHQEPAGIRKYNPHIGRDLEAIVAGCLEKRPEQRYATARDLADELGRYLRGEPVQARRVGRLVRGVRLVRRRRALAAAFALGLLAIALVGIGGAFAFRWYNAEKDLEIERNGPAVDDTTPEVNEVFPDVDVVVQSKEPIKTKPPGWRQPKDADFEFLNSTGESGLRLLMCNLTNHYDLDQPAPGSDPFGLGKNEWRTIQMPVNASDADRRMKLHTGLGWYAFFVRDRRGAVWPLYQRQPNGQEFTLGATNVFTDRRVVLEITAGSFNRKKRYYATLHRER